MLLDPGRRSALRIAATLGALGIMAATAPLVAAEDAAWTFAGASVTNPLGMATDYTHRRYWAVQAASGRLSILAFGENGEKQGAATSRDSPTSIQGLAFVNGQLYIGDVGGTRNKVTIYQIDGPVPGTEILNAMQIPLSYPDGSHDAAAIMANANDKVFVVTRGRNAAIYAAPDDPSISYSHGSAVPVNKLTKVADAPAQDITDAAFLVDGRIALRSASDGVIVLDGASYAKLGTQAIGATQKGGALTEALSQQALLTGADSDGGVVSIPIPGPAPAQPTAASTKKPEQQSSSTTTEENRSFAQTGTTVALVASVAVALLAAGVVLLKR